MATWSKKFMWIRRFVWVGRNQHGDRYKKLNDMQISICRIEADRDNIIDLRNLILLSSQLDAPVRYNFDADPQEAYIEVVSAEKLREII